VSATILPFLPAQCLVERHFVTLKVDSHLPATKNCRRCSNERVGPGNSARAADFETNRRVSDSSARYLVIFLVTLDGSEPWFVIHPIGGPRRRDRNLQSHQRRVTYGDLRLLQNEFAWFC